MICITGLIFLCKKLFFSKDQEVTPAEEAMSGDEWIGAPALDVELIDVNEYSRPGTALEKINGIVIHYTANPGSSAIANRDYFEGLKDAHTTKASSHFIVGLDGEIVQCIPSTEIAYASNERNSDTLSIECCHPDDSGKFNDTTYASVVSLTSWLCVRFGLTSQDVIRHYDVTGKLCPKYFVENEEAWTQFKSDVDAGIAQVQELRNQQ
ncbi:MAG: N-acetylmuramoyl-L-alanine amidase [Clostridia bacterium]|nr:N-acetylmuramoyl-L-alanine amidase [Clostridia bacterium]NCC43002.1 N-acetylmuramoyl-L-alanine amidase [Clostridia bacterium]